MESPDYWEGFDEAIQLVLIEVDKVLSKCYNDSRTRDNILDIRNNVKDIKEMAG